MEMGENLRQILERGKALRLGESAVISTKVHRNDSSDPGKIWVLSDQDAGQEFQQLKATGQLLHLDVFHEPVKLDSMILAKRIWEKLGEVVNQACPEEGAASTFEERVAMQISLAKEITLNSWATSGNVFDLASGHPTQSKVITKNHVHLLVQLDSALYGLIPWLVEGVEMGITCQGYELRRVEKVISTGEDQPSEAPMIPEMPSILNSLGHLLGKQNRLKHCFKLASTLGSLEDARELLHTLSPMGNLYLGKFQQKHDDLDETLHYLTDRGLAKKGMFFITLTPEGKELQKFLAAYQLELEVMLKRAIRRQPKARRQYTCQYNSQLKAKRRRLPEKKRVVNYSEEVWQDHVALPETVINAVRRSLLTDQKLQIEKNDLMVYHKRSWAPIDTCLLIDASGSMVGEKIRAVQRLAEHLVLHSREKLSVVTFQEMGAQVVVPFTKDYHKLQQGFSRIIPEGLTPLAHGITESTRYLQQSRARNPLLVLITDGMPNYPLWSGDAQADAVQAAREIVQQRIRFICIGLRPNAKYLTLLAQESKGNLFLVEDFNSLDFQEIVLGEWRRLRA